MMTVFSLTSSVVQPAFGGALDLPDPWSAFRRYGYRGTPKTLDAYQRDPEMRDMGHAAAHLIHGSSEGRFDITYAPGRLTRGWPGNRRCHAAS